jgi:replicative DNA helicase
MLEEVEREVFSVIQNNRPKLSNVFSIEDCLSELANELDGQKRNNERLETGFGNVDRLLGPLERGELIIVAGRPSMGKTTFALNIISNFLLNDKKVVFFSLEMPRKQITTKITASLGGFELKSVFNKTFHSNEDWAKYSLATGRLHNKKFSINDDGCLTVLDIKSCSRDVMNDFKGLDLIVVDYLGLIKPSSSETNKTQQISQISNDLKRLAKELNVPVIAVCQINRGVEARPDKRPNMSDLRDSGEIEQDADKIVFVYRDFIYNSGANEEETEIIIRKNRNGTLGTAHLAFKGNFARFLNIDTKYSGNVHEINRQSRNKYEERIQNDVL